MPADRELQLDDRVRLAKRLVEIAVALADGRASLEMPGANSPGGAVALTIGVSSSISGATSSAASSAR